MSQQQGEAAQEKAAQDQIAEDEVERDEAPTARDTSPVGSQPGENTERGSPLAGLKVVDLSRYLPGPLAAQLLASLGARVLKVEEPRLGDPVRFAPPRREGKSSLAALLLSGVESIALDLKKPAAIAVLDQLLAEADVLLESFRPGALARFGLAPETLRRRYPRLVICSLSGWGQDGPHAQRSGHDLTYQALAGGLASTIDIPNMPAADVVGAWSAVTAVLAALVERGENGRGAWIDAALYDAAVHSNLLGWAGEADRPKKLGEALPLTGALACYDLYRTADGGFLALALLEPHFWQRFCEAVEAPDLKRYHLRSTAESKKRLERLIAERTREEWAELMALHDLPGEPVLSASEAAEHPQLKARGVLSRGPDGLPRLAFPARFDTHRPRSADQVPELGEHTRDLLREHALEGEQLPRMKRRAGIGKRLSLKRWLMRLASSRSAQIVWILLSFGPQF